MIDDKGCIHVGMLGISLPNLSCDHSCPPYLLWFGPVVTTTAASRPIERILELYSSNHV